MSTDIKYALIKEKAIRDFGKAAEKKLAEDQKAAVAAFHASKTQLDLMHYLPERLMSMTFVSIERNKDAARELHAVFTASADEAVSTLRDMADSLLPIVRASSVLTPTFTSADRKEVLRAQIWKSYKEKADIVQIAGKTVLAVFRASDTQQDSTLVAFLRTWDIHNLDLEIRLTTHPITIKEHRSCNDGSYTPSVTYAPIHASRWAARMWPFIEEETCLDCESMWYAYRPEVEKEEEVL